MKPLSPRPLLHIEGLLVLVGACLAYRHLGGSWVMFAALFLAPDLFMFGYLVGAKAGAWIYNFGHTYVTVAIVLLIGFLTHAPFLVLVSVIWVAHIGFDRLLGYGLKYETAFKDTHLGKV
ncbi:MAG: DUF4260 domain-containing protein [Opitutaceae bacterium]